MLISQSSKVTGVVTVFEGNTALYADSVRLFAWNGGFGSSNPRPAGLYSVSLNLTLSDGSNFEDTRYIALSGLAPLYCVDTTTMRFEDQYGLDSAGIHYYLTGESQCP